MRCELWVARNHGRSITRRAPFGTLALAALLAILGAAACGDDDGGQNNQQQNNNNGNSPCGDGIVGFDEECDDGPQNSDVTPDACRTDCRPARCGDSVKDTGEVCDGADLAGETCEGLGYTAGTLGCQANCAFDTSACSTCGNGEQQGTEECDGNDLAGATCADVSGDQHGLLACHSDCTFDDSGCFTCGDGVVEPGLEECEPTDVGNATCADLGYAFGKMTCETPSCTLSGAECHAFCGNGILEPGEECDGQDLPAVDCAGLGAGFTGGPVLCTAGCLLSAALCHRCGNGTRDAEEECEGTDVGNATCETLLGAGASGTPSCTASCRLDASSCQHPATTCGDGAIEPYEQCDGANLGGATCADLPQYDGGRLQCTANCLFDTSACRPNLTRCGNGTAEPLYGEHCDGADLGGATCQMLGFASGTLACRADCTFDDDACVAPAACGNQQLDPGEQCDGAAPADLACTDLGFLGGTLGCRSNCRLDLSGCDRCGDGVRQPGEACDGGDLGGRTCDSETGGALPDGTLTCDSSCQVSTASCHNCGNGTVEGPEACDWGMASDCQSLGLGYDGGVFQCASDCLSADDALCYTYNDGNCQVHAGESRVDSPADCAWTQISAGYDHACALRGDGTVWCWGADGYWQLGQGPTAHGTPRNQPTQVVGLSDASQICTGVYYTCALRANHTVSCWGYNYYGQLGDGTASSGSEKDVPTPVLNLTGVVEVVCGNITTCARLTNGTVRCWGDNTYGSLGDGNSPNPSYTPVPVTNLPPTVAGIGVGMADTGGTSPQACAVRTAGNIYCWGYGVNGELGNGANQAYDTAVPVSSLGGTAVQVVGGGAFTLARMADGTAKGWGYNYYGMLGIGEFYTSYNTPQPVVGLTDVTDISAGYTHACAVRDNGSTTPEVWCWGQNAYGNLGDDSTNDASAPVQTLFDSGDEPVSVSAGVYFSCAVLADGSARCWGNNNVWQLGAQSINPYETRPVAVIE